MIVGFVGRAGAGKDYTADYLEDQGYVVHKYAWASALRYEIESVVAGGLHLPALWRKPYSPEIRALLQWWGTDLRRNQDPDYWVKQMGENLQTYRSGELDEHILAAITDCRFQNEVDAIRDLGGTIVRIWAPEKDRITRLGGRPASNHISETALDTYQADITIVSRTGAPPTPIDATSGAKWSGLLAQVIRWR